MKKIIFLSYAFITFHVTHAQNLSEDSKSRSSLLLPVDNINFRTSNLTVGFNYTYGLPSLLDLDENADITKLKPSRFIVGVNATGKNSDSISTLFQNGNFTPAASLDLKVGWRGFCTTQHVYERLDTINQNTDSIQAAHNRIEANQDTYINILGNIFYRLNDPHDSLIRKRFNKHVLVSVNRPDALLDSINNFLRFYQDSLPPATKTRLAFLSTNLLTVQGLLISNNSADATKNRLTMANRRIRSDIRQLSLTQYVFYIGIGRDSRRFNLLNDTASALANRYQKTTFAGARVYAGVNFYLPHHQLLGLQLGWQQTDNYDQLDIFEIESTTSITDSNRVDKQTKTFNVAAGKYGRFVQFPVMLDYVWFYKLPGKSIDAGALSLYARATFRDNIDLKMSNSYTLGGAAYFFNSEKSKFVGGIFLEHNWPRESGDTRPVYKRLTLGITTTFNLGSFDYEQLFQ